MLVGAYTAVMVACPKDELQAKRTETPNRVTRRKDRGTGFSGKVERAEKERSDQREKPACDKIEKVGGIFKEGEQMQEARSKKMNPRERDSPSFNIHRKVVEYRKVSGRTDSQPDPAVLFNLTSWKRHVCTRNYSSPAPRKSPLRSSQRWPRR
jgi:hypothetical protein